MESNNTSDVVAPATATTPIKVETPTAESENITPSINTLFFLHSTACASGDGVLTAASNETSNTNTAPTDSQTQQSAGPTSASDSSQIPVIKQEEPVKSSTGRIIKRKKYGDDEIRLLKVSCSHLLFLIIHLQRNKIQLQQLQLMYLKHLFLQLNSLHLQLLKRVLQLLHLLQKKQNQQYL